MFFRHTQRSDAPLVAAAVVSACRIDGWTEEIQPQFLRKIFREFFGYDFDFFTLEGISVSHFKSQITELNKRSELIDLMLVVEMLCPKIPVKATTLIDIWAKHLGVKTEGVLLARDLAYSLLSKAQEDFYRNNYFYTLDKLIPNFHALEERYGIKAIMLTVESSPTITARYEALGLLDDGTLGRCLWEFYKQRKFLFPGEIGSVNESVAHHDWIHVLADYDNDGIGEIEVSAFSTMTTDSPSAVVGFLGVLSIYQGGLLKTILQGPPHPGHELEGDIPINRIADALRRGKECNIDLIHEVEFFDYADRSVEELRKLWNIQPKNTLTKLSSSS